MIQMISRREFLAVLGLAGAKAMTGRISFAADTKTSRFYFAVLSDPHAAADSWVNALTEVKNLTANPAPQYGRADFLLVTGDTNPIDRRYENYMEVFTESDTRPVFLTVTGNHEADDSGGFPGGMGPKGAGAMGGGMAPQGEGAGQPPEMPQGNGGPQGQGSQGAPAGQSVQGGPQGGGQGGAGGMYASDGNPAIIDMEFIRDKIIPAIPGAVRMSDTSCTYYCDHENVRVISIDAYSGEAGSGGIINDKGRAWAEAAITSAPSTVDHIFVAFHAPAFPRVRHTHDSFNADAAQRNAFWNMLISHRSKVRAVFCGHTHCYARMRITDPAGAAANDITQYPDETGGIYQVNVGSTGNGQKNTFVRVGIEGKKVSFRAYEAENGKDKPFAVKEEWSLTGE